MYFHVDASCLYELESIENNFQWQPNKRKVLHEKKELFFHNVIITIQNTNYPIHILADSLKAGAGRVVILKFPVEKEIVFANSRIFGKAEQKKSPKHRGLYGVIFALQTYEFYIIGLLFPLYLYCDRRPIKFLWYSKGQLKRKSLK